MDLLGALQRYWGHAGFRPPQEEVIRAVLAGRDACAVMPTGGGKSLCYQLPAVLQPKTVIVLSPLIALMQDQVAELTGRGIAAAVLNSAIDLDEQREIMQQATRGAFRLIYLSPERLKRADTMPWLKKVPIALFAVDEAHCISEWGHEFRPEYRQLRTLRDEFPDVPVAAFTASATREVRHDILKQLRLRDPAKFVRSFRRPNLRYLAATGDETRRRRILLQALKAHSGQRAIVYAPTIDAVNNTHQDLKLNKINSIPYHGQMDPARRERNQRRWQEGEVPVLVGTLAFGMGINQPDVRLVAHLALPKSIEQYYQEAGRAGRDGEPADCLMLWAKRDAGLLGHFISEIRDPRERGRAWNRYFKLRAYAEGEGCRQRVLCEYFGEHPKWERCDFCDNCGHRPAWISRRGLSPTGG